MSLSIFEADLEKDKQAIIDILDQNRDYGVDSGRYEWLYLSNPFGAASVWLAKDEDNGKVIGAAAALPRSVWVLGKLATCHVLADFSIDQKYRSLGPALKLNRMSLAPVLDGSIPFAYDFPSDRMAVAHRWMKVEPIGKLLRYVRPIRIDSQIEKFFGKGLVGKGMNLFGNMALNALSSRNIDRTYSVRYQKIEADTFDASFTELDNLVGPKFKVCGSRNQAYLTWHYALNPLRPYFLVRLLQNDLLCGYAIFTINERRMYVYDLYSKDLVAVKRNLLSVLLRLAISEEIEAIEMSLLNLNPWIPFLKKCGFLLRPPPSDIFVFLGKDSPLNGIVNVADNWYMTQGDRDT